jgi:hypothetical protein
MPAGMSDLEFHLGKEAAAEALSSNFLLTASGVPEPILNEDGWFDVIAMSKKHVRRNSVAGGVYCGDKSGALKMK